MFLEKQCENFNQYIILSSKIDCSKSHKLSKAKVQHILLECDRLHVSYVAVFSL